MKDFCYEWVVRTESIINGLQARSFFPPFMFYCGISEEVGLIFICGPYCFEKYTFSNGQNLEPSKEGLWTTKHVHTRPNLA